MVSQAQQLGPADLLLASVCLGVIVSRQGSLQKKQANECLAIVVSRLKCVRDLEQNQ